MSRDFMNPTIPSIPLAQMFERTNHQGRRYIVGRLGIAKVLLIATGEISRGEPVWQLYLGQGPHATEEMAELALEVEARG